jgi:hypothetical protein
LSERIRERAADMRIGNYKTNKFRGGDRGNSEPAG